MVWNERLLYGFPEELEEVERIYDLLVDLRAGVRICNHLNRAKVRFSLCFVGSEGIDWLLANFPKRFAGRKQALHMMRTILEVGLIEHMVSKPKYEDSGSAFYRCMRAPCLTLPLLKEGHVSVSFSESRLQYFSMWLVVDSHGIRFFRAREHATTSYPLIYVPGSSIRGEGGKEAPNSSPEDQEQKNPGLKSPRTHLKDSSRSFRSSSQRPLNLSRKSAARSGTPELNSITRTFLDAGGDSAMGYQGVVWEFAPAMALWERMLAKQAAKNSSFIENSGGEDLVTGHEFVIWVDGEVKGGFGDDESEGAVKQIFFACGAARDKVEWLIAIDDLLLTNAPAEPVLLTYGDAVGLPTAGLVDKRLRDYGDRGIPCSSRLLRPSLKNDFLRSVVPMDTFSFKGWHLRANLLAKQGMVMSWNGFMAAPVSDSALRFGYFFFSGSLLRRFVSKEDFAAAASSDAVLPKGAVECRWDSVLPFIVEFLEEDLAADSN